jgi:hypothetical protein
MPSRSVCSAPYLPEDMTDVFQGPPDPLDVRVRLLEWEQRHSEEWTARVWLEDGTDAEGLEVTLCASASLRATHPLDPASVERAVASYVNPKWPAGHRLTGERGRAEAGGEYALDGDADAGLRLVALPIPLRA